MKKLSIFAMLFFVFILSAPPAHADDALNRALFEAISAGNVQEVQSLISRGADVSVAKSEIKGEMNVKDLLPVFSTPLGYALSEKNKDISRLLARNMVKFAVPFTWGNGGKDITYPLRTAVSYDDVEVAKILLQRGASIAEVEPLISEANNTAMADFLFANGANVNAKNADGGSALHIMAGSSLDVPVAEWLLAHGADINAKDNEDRTPLHGAVLRVNPMNVKFLLEHGAEVNAKDNKGETPLHSMGSPDRSTYSYGDKNKTKQLVALLLAYGADVNAKDRDGQTPLSRVTATADQDLIQALQAHGGKINVGPRVLFQQSLVQFKGRSDNETLRASIIDLALKLKPAPAIPPEAEAAAGRAAYIFKNAKSEDDALNAAKEYLVAIEVAPWVENYYYNLCTVLEKTPYAVQALHACKLYLEAAPNADDSSAMRQRIAGLQYAVDKYKKQLEQRKLWGWQSATTDEMYRLGGVSGEVSGKNVAIKLFVDWNASPIKYQVNFSCFEGDKPFGITRDLVSTDVWSSICPNTNLHLVIKPDGAGFIELGDGRNSIRTTLDELYRLRGKAHEKSEILSRNEKYFVVIPQGGKDNQHAGYAVYESDCAGNPLRQDTRALPDDFVTREVGIEDHKKSEYYTGNCLSSFSDKTGYRFWEKE